MAIAEQSVSFIEKPDLPVLSTVEANEGANQALVCRTCVHSGDRKWHLSLAQTSKIIAEGGDLDDFNCRPDEARIDLKRMLASAKITPITEDYPEGDPVVALIDTCGWQPMAKCLTCARFDPDKTQIPYPADYGVGDRYRPAVFAGRCTIPEEGITVDGRAGVTCDWQPKAPERNESCASCRFHMTTGPQWMADEDTREVALVDLDNFDRYRATRDGLTSANEGPNEVNYAIGRWRHTILARPNGVFRFVRGMLLATKKVTLDVGHDVDAWRVRFDGSGYEAWLLPSGGYVNDRDEVIDSSQVLPSRIGPDDDQRVAIQLTVQHLKRFGFQLGDTIQRRKLPVKVNASPSSGEPMTTRRPAPRFPERIKPGCAACQPHLNRACYFHAKDCQAIELPDAESEYFFAHPSLPDDNGIPVKDDDSRMNRAFTVEELDGDVAVHDVHGVEISIDDLVLRIRSIMHNNPAHRPALVSYYARRLGSLGYEDSRRYEIGWPRPSEMEPFKSYCALAQERYDVEYDQEKEKIVRRHRPAIGSAGRKPEDNTPGLDFREVMGDRFGIMRGLQRAPKSHRMAELHRDNPHGVPAQPAWSEQMELDEWLRGHNINERYTEQLLRTEATVVLDKEGSVVERQDWREPEQWHTTYLDHNGVEVEDVTPEELDELRAADREDYITRRDTMVTVKFEDATFEVPRGWLTDGYANFKGGRQHSESDDVKVLSFNHEDRMHERVRGTIESSFFGFECPTCGEKFTITEVQGHVAEDRDRRVMEETCPNDGAVLMWLATNEESQTSSDYSALRTVAKDRHGIGNAVAPDMPYWQNQTRLYEMKCPFWQASRSSVLRPITSSD